MMAAGEKEGSEEEDLQVAMVMKMGCCPSGYNALNVDPMALSSDLENESQDAGALFVLESKGMIYSSFIHSFIHHSCYSSHFWCISVDCIA
jgi:hypothetical protein